MAAHTVSEAKTAFHVAGDGSCNRGGQTTWRQFGSNTTAPHDCRVMWWEGGEEKRRRRAFGCETMTDERGGVSSSVYSRSIFAYF